MNQKSARIIATYFGLGLSKIAPGTMGSLGTLPPCIRFDLFRRLLGFDGCGSGIVCTGRESYGSRY